MKNLIAAAVLALSASPVIAGAPVLQGMEIRPGSTPQLEIKGLKPGERVRVHLVRMFAGWERASGGGWRNIAKPLHAWGDFMVDPTGSVRLWLASPLAGTYAGVDPYAILWSGRLVLADDGYLPRGFDVAGLAENQSALVVTHGEATLASGSIVWSIAPGLRRETVEQGRLNGAYSAPSDGLRHPTLILLHGSEGGSRDGSRALADRFAAQGYAAFAFNYFAWDLASLKGVPNAHVNQPIEMITVVRDWLARQPEADVRRLGLYGHSKGAEYAEVAAVRLPWIKAVAACVPTDAAWQGYGIGDERNRTNPGGNIPADYSSFSWKGGPLAYIPLDGDSRPYHSNTLYYEAKRAERPSAAAAAAIPVERAKASFLWLAGGRDEVWASGAMARRLDVRMRDHGAAKRSELHVYDRAGHGICGDGTYPTRLWAADSDDPRDPDRDADGRATADGWSRIKLFFARALADPKAPTIRTDLAARSPLARADQIKAPLLIFQGAKDPRVTQDQSDRIVCALRRREVAVKYLLAGNEGHSFANEDTSLAVRRATELSLVKNLGGPAERNASPRAESALALLRAAGDAIECPGR